MPLTKTALRFLFQRYMSWRLDELSDGKAILLDYRFSPSPRWGYGKPPHPELLGIFERGRPAFRHWIDKMLDHRARFLAIEREAASPNEPTFRNRYFLGLDAAALYAVLATEAPRLYVEVGSGNSTLFARCAIRDHALPTRIVSIDPQPRAEIEALCDRSIRKPLEDTDPEVFAELAAGDVLFIDNSHRSFQNSDVTVFFLEILPRLKPGVILHVHDIMLPLDYPPVWTGRYYSEQYLLACWLLANPQRFTLMLSNAFVSIDRELQVHAAPLWDEPGFAGARAMASAVMKEFMGQSFWARLT
jgi:hypothetical protein